MGHFKLIGFIVILILLLVIPAVQIYNYKAFSYTFREETIVTILKPLTKIDDEQAAVARDKIVAEVMNAGYTVGREGIEFKAFLPGIPRVMSREIFQITDPELRKARLTVEIPVTIKIFFFDVKRVITFSKTIQTL